MNIIWFLVVAIALAGITAGFVYIFYMLGKIRDQQGGPVNQSDDISSAAQRTADSVFSNEFREELKNRGRLHFEKVINENAMFLQQDLRLTTSQLNDFMKDEIKTVLKEEFATYEESIASAKDKAIESMQRTQQLLEDQRTVVMSQLEEQAASEKQTILDQFEKNMGDIVNHHIVESIGTEIDLSEQLDYIFSNLNDNKAAIIEDIKNGA